MIDGDGGDTKSLAERGPSFPATSEWQLAMLSWQRRIAGQRCIRTTNGWVLQARFDAPFNVTGCTYLWADDMDARQWHTWVWRVQVARSHTVQLQFHPAMSIPGREPMCPFNTRSQYATIGLFQSHGISKRNMYIYSILESDSWLP